MNKNVHFLPVAGIEAAERFGVSVRQKILLSARCRPAVSNLPHLEFASGLANRAKISEPLLQLFADIVTVETETEKICKMLWQAKFLHKTKLKRF